MLTPDDAGVNAQVGKRIAQLAATSPKAAKALEDFFVELERLEETAGELKGEVDSMSGAAERLSGKPNFGGGVVSVSSIAPRHHEVAAEMQKLLTQIEGGLRAGEAALVEVAERYATADKQSKRRMDEIGQDALEDEGYTGDETGGRPASLQ